MLPFYLRAKPGIINEAIFAGLDEKQLLAMLMDGMTAEKMRKMYKIFLLLKERE